MLLTRILTALVLAPLVVAALFGLPPARERRFGRTSEQVEAARRA